MWVDQVEPILSCEKVSRIYDDAYALIDVSTHLYAGRAKALLGSNGAGKSTLLGVCSSRMSASEGRVLFQGRPLQNETARFRRTLGVVSHQAMLYEELTGWENLSFFASITGGENTDTALTTSLESVGLTWAKDRRVDEYSRGMQQRLTLARALLHNPTVLLLDEPFSGLDQDGIALVLNLLLTIRDRGATILVSSHDLNTLTPLVDEALILERGRVLYDGPVAGSLTDLYRLQMEQNS